MEIRYRKSKNKQQRLVPDIINLKTVQQAAIHSLINQKNKKQQSEMQRMNTILQ